MDGSTVLGIELLFLNQEFLVHSHNIRNAFVSTIDKSAFYKIPAKFLKPIIFINKRVGMFPTINFSFVPF